MILGTFQKQPAETMDYDINYSEWLSEGDTIQSAVAIADINTIEVLSVYTSARSIKVWLRSGVSGVTYKITVTTTTADGRIRQDEFRIKCKEV